MLAVLLFGLQIIFGLLTVVKYIWPDPLLYYIPFNTSRAIHINLLVFWLLLGFMGGTYYMIPEESDTELYSVRLARLQFWLLAAAGVSAVVSYLLGYSWGMPFLEQPTIIKVVIVIAALIFLFNVFMTVLKTGKWTAIQGVLVAGMVFLAVMFLFGVFFMKNLATQYFFWWWVIHLWVEGAWELIAGAILAFLLLKLTGIERTHIEKWLYVEVGLVLFTGLIGTGHHYYWIGTPKYWYWWGGVFSALEPLPILLMVMDTMRHVRQKKIEITNRVALYWVVGGAWFHFVGAGVWGFAHTLPQINQWSHGTRRRWSKKRPRWKNLAARTRRWRAATARSPERRAGHGVFAQGRLAQPAEALRRGAELLRAGVAGAGQKTGDKGQLKLIRLLRGARFQSGRAANQFSFSTARGFPSTVRPVPFPIPECAARRRGGVRATASGRLRGGGRVR